MICWGQPEKAAPPPVIEDQFTPYGLFETQVRQFRRPNEGTLLVRGDIHNPYNEAVEGVRLVIRFRVSGKDGPRENERTETDLNITIPAGASAPFSREVSFGATDLFNDLLVVAFAKRRGAAEVEKPSREIEIAASKADDRGIDGLHVPTVPATAAGISFTLPVD